MAELNISQKGKRRTVTPRIDFTPMVDLGFLLITFFIYTTTLATPKVIDLVMPTNEPANSPHEIPAESTITLIPIENHRMAWYEGLPERREQLKTCGLTDIRDVLLRKQQQVAAFPATYSRAAHKVYVLIKPSDMSSYGDVVHILDEMIITGIANYTIMDITPEEVLWVKNI